jgi:hypothetical protein
VDTTMIAPHRLHGTDLETDDEVAVALTLASF